MIVTFSTVAHLLGECLPQDNFQRAKGQLCYSWRGRSPLYVGRPAFDLAKARKLENKEKFSNKQNWGKCKFDIYSMDLSFFDTLCMRKTILDIIIYHRGFDAYCLKALCQIRSLPIQNLFFIKNLKKKHFTSHSQLCWLSKDHNSVVS